MKKGLIFMSMLTCVLAFGFSQTAYTVRNVATWIEAVNGIRNGGNNQEYTINITGTVAVPATPSNERTFGSVTGVTVTIAGSGTLSPSANGSLLVIGKDQTVVAKDVTLRGRVANSASVVKISSEGIFRMEGKASIMGNSGGGVYVNKQGSFTMRDVASVSGNTFNDRYSPSSGGVHVDGEGTFTMQDNASVTGNTSESNDGGGGVYVDGRGTFTMQDNASVSGNTSSGRWGGGGVYVNERGTFTMQDGTISGNTAELGGGVHVKEGGSSIYNTDRYVHVNGGIFTMQGGTISGNTAEEGGGVYVGEGGTFTMRDSASVSGNTSSRGAYHSGDGGGVYINGRGTFTMHGNASVSGNKTSLNGGGVYSNSGIFTMRDSASISDNTAGDSGGGVYGIFTMQGGTISGNKATSYGGGVYGSVTKTGGTIYGYDAEQNFRNTAIRRFGHAMYQGGNKSWRNVTAGPTMNSDSYGFWLNDEEEEVLSFPAGFIGIWKRDNFNNTLIFTAATVKSSSRDNAWNFISVSDDTYTLEANTTAKTKMTLTIRLTGSNIVISGDSGSGENNWNGTWRKQQSQQSQQQAPAQNNFQATHKVVTNDGTNLRLRNNPTFNAAQTGSLEYGSLVIVLETGASAVDSDGHQGNWMYVTTPDGRKGWCFGAYLQTVSR